MTSHGSSPSNSGRLEFEPLDHEKFPAVDLAREALAMGDSGPAVLNAANEIAVHAFLEDRIAICADRAAGPGGLAIPPAGDGYLPRRRSGLGSVGTR